MPRKKNLGLDWINIPLARARLQEIDRAIASMQAERQLLQKVLGGAPAGLSNGAARRRPGRPPGGSGPSMLDAISAVMVEGPASRGWVVADLKAALAKRFPQKVAAPNASALISSALIQALRAKRPRFVGRGGGPGKARRYKLAAAAG